MVWMGLLEWLVFLVGLVFDVLYEWVFMIVI